MNKLLELALKIKASVTGKQAISDLSEQVDAFGHQSENADPKAQALAAEISKLGQQEQAITAFKQQKNATHEAEKQWQQAQQQVAALAKTIRQAQTPNKQLTKQFEQSKIAATKAKTAYQQQNQSLQKSRSSLSDAGIASKQLSQAQRDLNTRAQQLKNQLEQLNNSATANTAKTRSNTQATQKNAAQQAQFGERIRTTTSRLLAMASAYLGINVLKQKLIELFTTGDKFERLDTQLQAVMGSIEGGKQASAWIKDFTKNTPLQLEEVTRVFVKLKAFGLDPMDGSMQSIIDQTYKLGGSFQEAQGISLALGQAWAKQKLQGEEILQLIERGVPVWELLEKATGKNTAELQKLSTAGLLGRDSIQALMDEMASGSQGAAANNMSLLSGLISNTRDNLAKFYKMVSDNGALDWLKAQIKYVNDEFDRMAANGELQAWAKRVSNGIIQVGEAIKSSVSQVLAWRGELLLLGKAWAGLKLLSWVGQLKTLVVQLQASALASTATATKFNLFGSAISAASIKAKAFAGVLKGVLAVAVLESIGKIIELGQVTYALVAAKKALSESEATTTEAIAQTKAAYAALSESLGIVIRDTEHFQQLIDQGIIHFNQATQSWQKGAAPLSQIATKAKSAAEYLDEINAAAKRSTTTANTELGPAFKALGLDFEALEGRASESFQGIEQGLDTLIAASQVSGDAVYAYLNKAFDSARNQYELDQLSEALETLGAQSKLSEQQLQTLQQRGINLGKELASAASLATHAYQQLGITSAAALNQAANANRIAIDQLIASHAPIEDLKAGWLAYAESAIAAAKASGQVPPSLLQSEAAALGLSKQLQALAESYGRVKTAASNQAKANDTAKNSTDDLSNSIDQLTESIKENNDETVLSVSSKWASKDATDAVSLSIRDLRSHVDELTDRMSFNSKVTRTGYMGVMALQQIAYDKTSLAIAKQVLLLRQWEVRVANTQAPSQALINKAEQALGAMDKLDSATLSNLRSQIDSARSAMASLRDNAQDALRAAQDANDRYLGNAVALENRDYQQTIGQLEAQLKQAKQTGDNSATSDLKQAIQLQSQLHQNKLNDLKAEQAVEQASAKSSSTVIAPSTSPSVTSETVEVLLRYGDSSVSVTTDASGKADLLDILSQAGLSST
ncbi:tape measure protein [Agarivorans sp. QJM3NY_25]|uniref:tape measure protein n=1 Tax=Agarivorans sp. QJM3NY_25 TaxID=3421430 RepID=UPI003D7CE254